jgi:hypothetical protein
VNTFTVRYRRIMRHRDHRRAFLAAAHAMLITACHFLARAMDHL